MRRTLIVLLAMGIALGTGACGSSDGSGNGARLANAEFLKQGNAACKAAGERLDAASKKAFEGATEANPPSEATVKALVEGTAIPEFEKLINRIDDLSAPKDLEAKVEAAVTESRRAIKKAKANPAAVVAGDDTTFAKSDELIAATGLTACSE